MWRDKAALAVIRVLVVGPLVVSVIWTVATIVVKQAIIDNRSSHD